MSKMNVEDYEAFPRKRQINIIMRHGVSFGSALAMAISFNINHSVQPFCVMGNLTWLIFLALCGLLLLGLVRIFGYNNIHNEQQQTSIKLYFCVI